MQANELKPRFKQIKQRPKTTPPLDVLKTIGTFTEDVLRLLAANYERVPINWKGKGTKTYQVFVDKGQKLPFSRAANVDLFLSEPGAFATVWQQVLAALDAGKSAGSIVTLPNEALLDQAFYTAVIAFASAIDLHDRGDRGSPGNLLETAVGAAIAHLTGLDEHGQVSLSVPNQGAEVLVTSNGAGETEDEGEDEQPDEPVKQGAGDDKAVIKTDRWFQGASCNLVVAFKISTRERISQVSVQQLMLDKIKPGGFRSILCAGNENNVVGPKGLKRDERTYDKSWLTDTLVPNTIALYHRFIAPYAGLYYLDPPESYLNGDYAGLPPVKRFRELLTADLPKLLGLAPNKSG